MTYASTEILILKSEKNKNELYYMKIDFCDLNALEILCPLLCFTFSFTLHVLYRWPDISSLSQSYKANQDIWAKENRFLLIFTAWNPAQVLISYGSSSFFS